MKTSEKMAEQPQSEKIEKSGTEIAQMSVDERKAYFAAKGYKPERLDTTVFGQSSNLPAKGKIVDILEVVYEIEQAGKTKQKTNGLRIVATDETGKTFECSLGRAALRGIIKTETKKSLDLDELTTDKNSDIRINGKNLSDLPNHPVLIYDFLGKSFTAEKITVFEIPFGKKYKTKHEALENIVTREAFAVSILD